MNILDRAKSLSSPAGTILLTNRQLDEWVRIHLWRNMGIEPEAKDYNALVKSLKELFHV